MSYHYLGGSPLPPMTSTQAFAEAVDPYSWRFSPPGAVFSPYGWGPDFNVGMPMNYTHHIGYERVPIPGVRRNIGQMYDVLWPYGRGTVLSGSWSGSAPGYEASSASLAGILAVM
jgi:hypothetical protein